MKRGLFLIASIALSSALYAQTEPALLSREQVLDLFAQYNPSVLEKAKTDTNYQAILEAFVRSYRLPDTLNNQATVIAGIRNFENSLRLQALTQNYKKSMTLAKMSGQAEQGVRDAYRQELKEVMTDIWVVSVQVRQWQLDQLKQQLRAHNKEKGTAEDKQALQTQVQSLKSEIAALKKQAGETILANTDAYLSQVDVQLGNDLYSRQLSAARKQNDSALQAPNLHIKTNHKKPVAK